MSPYNNLGTASLPPATTSPVSRSAVAGAVDRGVREGVPAGCDRSLGILPAVRPSLDAHPIGRETSLTTTRLLAIAVVAVAALAAATLQAVVPWHGDRLQFLLLAGANATAASMSAWLFHLRWSSLLDTADRNIRNVFLPVSAHFLLRLAIEPLDLELETLAIIVQSSWVATQTLAACFLLVAFHQALSGDRGRSRAARTVGAVVAAVALGLLMTWLELLGTGRAPHPAGIGLTLLYALVAFVPLLDRSGRHTRREIWLGATFLLIATAHLDLSWSARPYDPPFMWGHLLMALSLLAPVVGAMRENVVLIEGQVALNQRIHSFRRRLEVLLDSLPGPVMSVNRKLELLYANLSAQQLLDVSHRSGELSRGGAWLDGFVDPDDRAFLERAVARIIDDGEPEVWRRVVQLEDPDGLVHWLNLELHHFVDPVEGTAAVQVVATDVTDLQLARRTSEGRQSRLAFLSNTAQTVAGEIAVERVLERFLVLGREVYPLRSLRLWQPSPDLSHLETVLAVNCDESAAAIPPAARARIGAGDHPAWRAFRDAFPHVASSTGALTDPDHPTFVPLLTAGLSVGVLQLDFDATTEIGSDDLDLLTQVGILLGGAIRLARLVQELDEQRAVAMEASRLKSEFLANTSHELRTPLTAILGFLRLLVENAVDDPARRREFLQITLDSAEKLLVLINDVLDLAKIEAGRLEVHNQPVPARHVLEDVEGLFRHQMRGRGISFTIEAAPAQLVLWADRDRTTQILTNLLSNSLKFTPRGGSIRVACRSEDGGVAFTVTDSGAGISPGEVERVFESFYQVDGSTTRLHGGTGLGLTISRRLAELMGGTLRLDSSGLGHGTTAVLSLPAYRGQV